ncbi:MAG TPA: hypothetical protein VF765_27650 [Polyangiaceae bacterium]
MPKESVDAVLNPMGVPEYKGPTGSVEGTISVVGPPAPVQQVVDTGKCPAALDMYGKLFREGTPATPNGPRALADAVVVAVGWGNGFFIPEKKDAVHLTVGTNCLYPSRAIAITYGQRIEVSNQSDQLFAPIIDQAPMPAVMVAPPKEAGDAVKLYPEKAGYFTMSDRMQPFVKEDLYVFRHPLHTVSDRDGHYRIDGIPVGAKVTIGASMAEINAKDRTTVEIKENVVAHADITLTYKPPPPGGPANRAADGGIIPPWRMPNE